MSRAAATHESRGRYSHAQVRSRYLGDACQASMLLVVPALVRPGFLVEIEILAAKN